MIQTKIKDKVENLDKISNEYGKKIKIQEHQKHRGGAGDNAQCLKEQTSNPEIQNKIHNNHKEF